MTGAPPPERLWEVDLARTAAIAMMVVYHAVYDIDLLASGDLVDPFSSPWRPLQVACGSTFLAVAGVSFHVSWSRARARGLRGAALWRKHARRGVQLLAWGALVGAVTLAALGTDDYVRFGILSAIGACIILGPLVARLGAWNLVLAAAAVAGGLALSDERSDVPGALILGVKPPDGAGVDWYPLLPWLGPFLAGLAVAALLYPGGRRGAWAERFPKAGPLPVAEVPGRHSLAIYLVHQPVLIALVAAALAVAGVEMDGL